MKFCLCFFSDASQSLTDDEKKVSKNGGEYAVCICVLQGWNEFVYKGDGCIAGFEKSKSLCYVPLGLLHSCIRQHSCTVYIRVSVGVIGDGGGPSKSTTF